MSYFVNNESATVNSNRILYTASSFARSSLLHLQEIGELVAKKAHSNSRSDLNSFLFFIVLSGNGKISYGGNEYALSEGSCVFINCKKPYCHTTEAGNLWSLRWCHFYGPTLSSIYGKYIERGGSVTFKSNNKELINSIWSDLMTTAKSSDYMRDMKINEHISSLLTYIMSESWHPENRREAGKRQSVLQVKEYMDEHYKDKITLEFLSSQFFISKYYLTHCFKDQFGISISNYLSNVRITKAKQLLRFTENTVENIAISVGIADPAYFSKLFKSIEGVPPTVYREQW